MTRRSSVCGVLTMMAMGATLAGSFATAAPAAGTLEVSYQVSPKVEGSRFSAMWLENEAGELVKTLFVSSELAQGAFTVEGEICPDWVKKAQWEKASQDQVDAVSGPTPVAGANSASFDLAKAGIEPGVYTFLMQVHVHEEYNILFKGKLRVGEEPADVRTEVVYTPKKYEGPEDLVHDVTLRFTPGRGAGAAR
jgi:hypothetical protein